MQSNGARALVALVSIAAIVALLVLFAGGDDDDDQEATVAQTTTTETETAAAGSQQGEPAERPPKPEKPEFETITVKGGEPQGGVEELSYAKGDDVRIEVRSDVAEEVHVHGYDLFEEVEAGGRAKFNFPASIEGVFEVELEQSGVQLAQLTVKP